MSVFISRVPGLWPAGPKRPSIAFRGQKGADLPATTWGLLGLPAAPPQHAGTSPWPRSMAPCGSHHEAFSGTKRTN